MINTAIIPVAGFGTRMLPASKSVPKEMLPLGDKPIIHFIVEECVNAGIENIVFVNHSSKTSLEDYFDRNMELEVLLENSHKNKLLNEVRKLTPKSVNISSVRQNEALGLGHAILAAKSLVGEQPFAVILPDVLLKSQDERNNLANMIKHYDSTKSSQILLEQVSKEKVSNYGIVGVETYEDVNQVSLKLSSLVEKPKVEDAPSNLAVVGRYIFTPKIWKHLSNVGPGVGGEIQLTDAILSLLDEESVYGLRVTGKSRDCGCKDGYYKAFVEQALASDEENQLIDFLAHLVKKHQSITRDSSKIERLKRAL